MTGRRSAWPGWAVLVGWVVAWDLYAAHSGRVETMSACWRRWRRTCPVISQLLATAVSWLDHHLDSA